jgi:hypothetical protein
VYRGVIQASLSFYGAIRMASVHIKVPTAVWILVAGMSFFWLLDFCNDYRELMQQKEFQSTLKRIASNIPEINSSKNQD